MPASDGRAGPSAPACAVSCAAGRRSGDEPRCRLDLPLAYRLPLPLLSPPPHRCWRVPRCRCRAWRRAAPVEGGPWPRGTAARPAGSVPPSPAKRCENGSEAGCSAQGWLAKNSDTETWNPHLRQWQQGSSICRSLHQPSAHLLRPLRPREALRALALLQSKGGLDWRRAQTCERRAANGVLSEWGGELLACTLCQPRESNLGRGCTAAAAAPRMSQARHHPEPPGGPRDQPPPAAAASLFRASSRKRQSDCTRRDRLRSLLASTSMSAQHSWQCQQIVSDRRRFSLASTPMSAVGRRKSLRLELEGDHDR